MGSPNSSSNIIITTILSVYSKFRLMQSMVRIQRYGEIRNQAALKIAGLRKVRMAIRYLRRLKRLRMLIRLQSMIKMHIYRKRYRRMIRRKRMIMKIIRSIRAYLLRKRIQLRIIAKLPKVTTKNQSSLSSLQSTSSY